jgi:hypothetical protein
MTTGALTRPVLPDTPVELGPRAGNLSYREARQSPCLSCVTSPCCTHLLLATIELKTLMDIDHATFLLNFEGIVLALGTSGASAQVYLHQSCGFLDVPTGLCNVHSTPLQPAVCSNYNAHSCGYRRAMTTDLHPEHPLLDRHRMAWLAARVVFDDNRRVTAVPDWGEMLEAFASMPMQRVVAPPPPPDPIVEEWRTIVLSKKGSNGDARPLRHYGDPEVSDPCTGCGAWCCQTLVFKRGLPGDASQLEFLRYCVGFPGVEVGVAADSWAVIVRTTCRHLDGNRCSVFGTEERPLKCGYYDARSCGYRGHFGVPQPDDIVRVCRDQFGIVASSIVFDELGRIVAIPPIEVLRSRLEDAERAGAAVTVSSQDEARQRGVTGRDVHQ